MEYNFAHWFLVKEKKNLILYNNHKYYKKDYVKYLDAFKWQCINKKCTAKINVNQATNQILKNESIHNVNHGEETNKSIIKNSFSNGLKRKSEDELERPSKIINRGILNNPEVTKTFTSTDINNIYQCLYRFRRSSYPKLPTNLMEVINVMSERQVKTVQDEDFILLVDSGNKIICFSTNLNLKLLCSVDKIFVNGTLTYCAKYFLQLFTIHIFKNGHYVPLVYFLLPDKYKDTYARSFGNWLKLVFGLPLLNSEEVSDCFTTDLMSISLDDERVGKYCDYLVDYYIDEGAKFNPRIWASREITSERTTNSCVFSLKIKFTINKSSSQHFYMYTCFKYKNTN
ncbi:hypothetical protein AGLY_014196 [Aphis glycines]|uniref:FLYWCH-type domain-containing protein n=1 Tax=Aphis glycines TaxID=307491 RepID=A0A6G0T516_APHGL|nr:hypothetical protein AGLY_014196 [Aphis glycines]